MVNKALDYGKYDIHEQEKCHNEGLLTKATNIHITLITILLLLIYSFFVGITVFFILYALKEIGVIIVAVTGLLLLYFIPLRPLRKRLTFMRKLKRLCREQKLIFEKKRGIIRGLKLNTKGFDFTVSSQHVIYCVRFYTPRRRASHIIICDKNTIAVRTNIHKNRFKLALGINKTRVRKMPYSYNDIVCSGNKRAEKVLLVNPVPYDMFKKNLDGSEIPIGTGERIFDYVLYNATGFLNTLEREY